MDPSEDEEERGEQFKIMDPLLTTQSEDEIEKGEQSVFIASLSPTCFGLALGVGYANIGGILDSDRFKKEYDMSDSSTEILAGIMQLGCIIGSAIASRLADRMGRVVSLKIGTCILLLGSLLCSIPLFFSNVVSIAFIYVGRTFIGIAGGILCAVVPIYTCEIAPTEYRGAIESSFQVSVELGILIGYVVNYLVIPNYESGWKISFFAQFLVTTMCIPMFLLRLLPSSSHWLEMRKKRRLLREQDEEKTKSSMFEKETRGDVIVALAICTLQVGTGIDMLTVYAPQIFSHALDTNSDNDDDDDDPKKLLYTIFVGLTFFCVTPFTVIFVDRIGRRPILLLGCLGMTISLFALSISEKYDGGILSIVFALLFVFCFSFSWGPIAWVIPSEMISTNLRARVISLGTVLNWIADYLVVSTFLSLKHALGSSGVFLFYCAINVGAMLFVFKFVPETKGISLAHH